VSLNQALSALACAGYLAFATMAWRRSGQSRIAAVLSVLLLDVFAWNFAELAQGMTSAHSWAQVDRFFASLLPALAFHTVTLFVGKARSWQALVLLAYLAFGALALAAAFWPLHYGLWWKSLLASAGVTMAAALQLLVSHLRRSVDSAERARTRLVLIASLVATLVGSSDLWLDKIGLPRLRVSNLGMFAALGLFAAATLRLELLGKALPARLVPYALLSGTACVLIALFAIHALDASVALQTLGAVSTLVLALLSLREISRIRTAHRQQTEQLLLFGRWSEQLAHDLGNPLAALRGSLQFLSEEHRAGRSLDVQAEYIGLMLTQCDRLQHHVQAYRRLARVEPVRSAADVNDVVARVLALQAAAKRPGISLHQRLDRSLPGCTIDAELVATALENIIQNAFEALGERGSISVQTVLRAGDLGDLVVLSVEDDGPGIDPRLAERVTDALVTTKAGGSGLGLAFADRVAKAHGGTLEIDTRLGRGTAVRMIFPAPAAGHSPFARGPTP
jgi:two-component system, NtrC family, sensor histidine kinase HydH